MNATFKSGIAKMENQCYKINNRPVCLNEGGNGINFVYVDKKKKEADFNRKPISDVKKKFFKVSPCLANQTVCTLKTRRAAK